MRTTVSMEYHLTLSSQEFRLISSALRGGLKPAEIEEARLLQLQMMKQRITEYGNYAKDMENLKSKLKEVEDAQVKTEVVKGSTSSTRECGSTFGSD